MLTEDEKKRRRRRYEVVKEDQRNAFQRDRDRILYSSAFRRLSGITQIVRSGEADVFHTRQEHTLKVAQVGRRLAQIALDKHPELCAQLGLHEEVVEAACLAHDLGHPPFGHMGEHVLNDLVQAADDADGFEGNAQSFRVVTKLAVRFEECPGLDLSRATLASLLKYPWLRDPRIESKKKKWGAYKTEKDDFTWCREFLPGERKSLEAELMDWADDIAYSVHDLEDFHRCGAIPWGRILDGDETEAIVKRAAKSWFDSPADAEGRLRVAHRNLVGFIKGTWDELVSQPYSGSKAHRQQLRHMTSSLVARYITAFKLQEPDAKGQFFVVDPDAQDEIRFLKQITRDYIIDNPSLSAQQHGQKRIIENLFDDIHRSAKCKKAIPNFLPRRLHYIWDLSDNPARFTADCIAALSEAEAVGLHARLRGLASGSVLDPIVR